MSSPTSDASSSRDSVDDSREQSTKDRRRERNRLAAQKHRLRRNERMSQLEQQVLALQQDKNQLIAQLDSAPAKSSRANPNNPNPSASASANPSPAAAGSPSATVTSSAIPIDPQLESDLPPRAKRARTATSADRDHPHARPSDSNSPSTTHAAAAAAAAPPPPHASQLYEDTIHRMEERIVELERWSEELNGDLADALDSETRLKRELHHTAHSADAHAHRLADALRAAESERTRHLREIADLRDALDAEVAAARTLRDANYRLRESVEAAERTLDMQRVENERLRARVAEEDSKGAAAAVRLENALLDARQELEDVHGEARRLRKLLRDQEALEEAAAETRQRKKEREDEERRRTEERENSAQATIASLTARLSQAEGQVTQQKKDLEEAYTQLDRTERESRQRNERISSLTGSLEKVGAFLTSKGIPIDVD